MPGMMDTILNLGLNDKTVDKEKHRMEGCQDIEDLYKCTAMSFWA